MNLNYFKIEEFDSPDLPGSGMQMERDFLRKLDKAREIADISFRINSGYRTAEHNAEIYRKLGRTEIKSSHMGGWAADIACTTSIARHKIISALLEAGFNRLGISGRFIHVDCDPDKPAGVIWTY